MKLAVVILNWNNAEETVACVRRVSRWSTLRPQIWVVDNASRDGSAEIIAECCPGIQLLRSPINRGFGGGNNLAIEAARRDGAQAILLLNNDATIEEDSAGHLMGTLSTYPDAGIVGPFVSETYDGRTHYSLGGRNIARNHNTRIVATELPRNRGYAEPVDYVSGTAPLIRAEMFDHVALFDEEYFFSGEMADLCERAKTRGYQVLVVPSALASHHDTAGIRRHTLYAYYSLRNRFLYVRKHASPWYLLVWTGRCLRLLWRHLRARQFSIARCHWLALADGLLGRYGNQHARVHRG